MTMELDSIGKRQLLYLPAVNRSSFLLFFQKGLQERSWSLRDYSQPGRVEVRYADEFDWDAAEVRRMAEQSFDAPVVSTTRLDFWHEKTRARNAQFGLTGSAAPARAGGSDSFPLLAERELLGLAKAKKAEDMKRIRTSANSEDWVTWNFLHLLQSVPTSP